jgi:tetratricopeptide (TPR) repeat protein
LTTNRKSQLAIEYSYEFNAQFPDIPVLWINAGSQARRDESYRKIAQTLSIRGCMDSTANPQKLVANWLLDNSIEGWLLILDNADDIEDVFGEDPAGSSPSDSIAKLLRNSSFLHNGSIVVTTRDGRLESRLAILGSTLQVPVMSTWEALGLLKSRIPFLENVEHDAKALLAELGLLPLAITQASAFIIENRITIPEYLELFRGVGNSPQEALYRAFEDPRRLCQSDENSVMKTWELSFKLIGKSSPRAAAILSAIAHLDQAGIPEALLHEDGESQVQFKEALGVLKAFSFVTAEEEHTDLTIHPLIQLSTQRWLQNKGLESDYAQNTLIMVSKKFPSTEMIPIEVATIWNLCERLLPHALRVEKTQPLSQAGMLAKAKLQMKIGEYELVRGRCLESIDWHAKAAENFSNIRESDADIQRAVLQNLSDLAIAKSMAGFTEESGVLHQRAIAGIERLLGRDHPLTISMLLRMAENLNFQQRFRESNRLYNRIHSTRVTLLGPNHLDTIDALSNSATALEWLGRFSECESVCRHVVERLRACLPGHPKLYYATSRLSSVLQKLGKTTEAEALARETLQVRLRIYGSENSILAWSMHILSLTLRDQGRLDEAGKYSRMALEIRESTMGSLHPVTALALFNLAFLKYGCGEDGEARVLLRDGIQRIVKGYGRWHPLAVVASAEYIRMKNHSVLMKIPEQIRVERKRAYWVALSSKQISLLAQCIGTHNPNRKPWEEGFLLLEAYLLLAVDRLKTKTILIMRLLFSVIFLFLTAYLCRSLRVQGHGY